MIGTSLKRVGGQKIKGLKQIKIETPSHINGTFDSSINSSLVKEIDYNEQEQMLQVTFTNGFKAKYNVSKEEYQDLLQAESIGKWVRHNLWERKYV